MCRNKIVFFIILILTFNANSVHGKKIAHLNMFAEEGSDITEVLQHLVDNYDIIVIDDGIWYLSYGIKLRSNVTIKGIDKDKSIIKRSISGNMNHFGLMFYTEDIVPHDYILKRDADFYEDSLINYCNIHFVDLTIDLNRNTELDKNNPFLTAAYSVVFYRTKNSSIKRCCFIDGMTSSRNNPLATVVCYQSGFCSIEDCRSSNVTFLQLLFCKKISVKRNVCRNSIGTAIETISGCEHIIKYNSIDNVLNSVSCMGINSLGCLVEKNIIQSGVNNISCLTLGHEGHLSTDASHSVARSNIFNSLNCRSIIIQQGHDILIKHNYCTCVIGSSAPNNTSGCVVVAANEENGLYNIKIINNSIENVGDAECGCVTYRGSGNCIIKKNRIKARYPIAVICRDCVIEVISNTFVQSEHIIAYTNSKITMIKNKNKEPITCDNDSVIITKEWYKPIVSIKE